MANEVTLNFGLQFSKSGSRMTIPSETEYVDVSAQPKVSATQSIGTTHELVAMGDVGTSTAGVSFFRNLDSTNYVKLGLVASATFYPLFIIPAGKKGYMPRLANQALYAKANTASVNLEYFITSQ